MRAFGFLVAAALLAFHASAPISSPASEAKPPDKSGGRWALLIGVDDYLWARKLEYCGADMKSLSEHLVASGFPKEHVYLLHDKAEQNKNRPSKTTIETHLRLVLSLVERNDLLIVGFSGHGVHLKGKSYLCPPEAKLEDPNSLVSVDALYERLEKCPAALKLLVMDACRNDPRPDGERSFVPTEGTKQFAQSLEQPPRGILQLTSCAPGEIAREERDFGHGVFMHFLLEGLQGTADSNGNGSVSLMELYLYTNDKTKSYVAQKYVDSQRPALKGEIHDDFNLVLLSSSRLPVAPQPRTTPTFPSTTPTRSESPLPGNTIVNSIGMNLVSIPAGEFMMGSPESDKGAEPQERPQHRVRITRSFLIGAYEVTQAEYQRVMGSNPSYFSSQGAKSGEVSGQDTSSFPVEHVDWAEAVEFCRRLSQLSEEQAAGRVYQLPTEAQWEYACRAGSTLVYYSSNDDSGLEDYAWISEGRTCPVGQKKPNAWGLYDMLGNVWEWCADGYDANYYAKSPTDDPLCSASDYEHTIRGRGWVSDAARMSCANRKGYAYSYGDLGFRVVCLTGTSPIWTPSKP